MKILFIVPSYKPAYIYGGPIVVVALLAEQLVQMGNEVSVYTTTANGKTELDVTPGAEVLVDGVKVTYFKRVTGDHTHASPDLWKHLGKTVKQFDAVHIHSWWNLLVIGAAWVCKRNGVKPVLSPHGMFSNYILETNNSGKKRWIHKLIGKKMLENSWLHVSTQLEWDESQAIIPGWKGGIIPNLVKLSEKKYTRKHNDIFTIAFLSRVDPKKGLDVLVKALAGVDFDYKLKIAGSGEEEYISSIKKMAADLGNADKLEWVGWKNGEDKFEYLAGADLFALTSHSENFAIVVIESLSVGTPVMISNNVGLYQYIQKNDYGWVTDMQISEITAQLNAIAKATDKLQRINNELPGIIKHEYDGANLAKQYVDLYNKANSGKLA
ncbi:XrtY-associated glycosyltransferase XYAG1 [Mucilaginibacter terrae]|uniref:Glycosyltransferase involved in cell wall biosynthesis n=1 Tax=Mucilaginibacter terrae TaxID=1955052 RepID=A0ABU3GYE2_9SPHI|nr:glycosyltransferase [Mucilaginibacter terrae]MDT3404792.1 glycosyltransferase involved in cell wall biosynthesis [Mucilaginibacter terrae]